MTTQQAEPIADAGRARPDAQLVLVDSGAADRVGAEGAGADGPLADAGARDVATPDAGVADAAAPDTRPLDTGVTDHAPGDLATADLAAPDASLPDLAGPDTTAPDRAAPDTTAPDRAAPDTSAVDSTDPCDQDGDGVRAQGSCGGTDCDDSNPGVHPGATEVCSFVDEDCQGGNNEGLTCTLVAVSATRSFEIDPFARTAYYTEVDLPSSSADVAMYDVDTDLDGDLIVVTADRVYELAYGVLVEVSDPPLPPLPNGLAINAQGVIHICDSNGASSQVATLDRSADTLTTVAALDPYASSGDCAFLDDGRLVMSALGASASDPDRLVQVDLATGVVSALGGLGYADVWGLSAAWGYLFGLTGNGELLRIDPATGASTALVRFVDENSDPIAFYGAAGVR